METHEVRLRVVLKNTRAVTALRIARREIAELSEEFPYRPEITKALKALKYATKNLTTAQQ